MIRTKPALSGPFSNRHFTVQWIDLKRAPQQLANPNYPDGVGLDGSRAGPACLVELPYPAARCGVYALTCQRCGQTFGCTTAGRADDPRTVRLPCVQK